MTILCVDDDPDDRQLLCEAIQEICDSTLCISVKSGQETLNFLRGGIVPDIIIMDIYMPVMNGIDCLTQIRADQDLKELRVIMFSTQSNPINDKKIKSLRAEFIPKPNSYRDLIHILNAKLYSTK